MKIIFLLICFIASVTLAAQPGTLDNSFGTGGKVLDNTSVPYVEILDAIIQTDGKILVLADAEYNHVVRIVVLRYNANGTLDNTFSNDGIADGPLPGTNDDVYPSAIKLQADGKILVCGASYNDSLSAFVVRYNTNGLLDNSFGSTGVVYIQDAELYGMDGMVVLPNGQIVLISGRPNFGPGAADLALIKLNTDGSLNGSFGIAGIASIDVVQEFVSPHYSKIELQNDGKFVVGGSRNASGFGSTDSVLVIRVNVNGTIDNTYGTNGVFAFTPGSAGYNEFADMAIQPDGKIIVSGYGFSESNLGYTHVTRINTNGTKDNSFGTNGVYNFNNRSTGFGSTGQLSLQADGKVLVAGFSKNALDNYAISAARLTTAGVLDAGFDGDGIALLQVNSYGSYGIAPLQQPDGRIVLAGYAGNGNAYTTTIGRFTATGQTDNTISAGSTAIAYIGSGTEYEEGENILVQPDQKIINVRSRGNGFGYNIGLSRHLPNGTLDNSFGLNGRTIIDLPAGYSDQTFSALLTNGKIMVVSDFEDIITGGTIGLLRFNATGFPDSTFGTNGKLFFSTNSTHENLVIDAAVQPDGKMVILTSQYFDDSQFIDTTLLIRLNADGSYDNSFNGTGKLVLTSSPDVNYTKLLVQPDGKIVYQRVDDTGTAPRTLVTRLNANGTLDAGFNGGNAVSAPLRVAVTTLQPDGKIVLAEPLGKIIRLNSNGTFDATFDGDGIAELTYYFDTYEGLQDIKIQADGKILLSGSAYDGVSSGRPFRVVRINTSGTIDASFGTDGTATVAVVTDNYNTSNAMALQADGKILLTGFTENTDEYYSDFAMIRLNGNNVTPGTTYTFTGNGAWNVPANWSNGAIPPATLPSGSTILIDPIASGECVLSTVQNVSAGASFTVKAGKKFRIVGGLIVQ